VARPFKCRCVGCTPASNYFKPRGIPLTSLEEVNLTMDEFEAIRLADLEGLYQEAAAERMKVSRQTFGNIISSAHKKTAEAIVGAKALRIEGGVVEILDRHFVCYECGNEWAVPCGSGRPEECPKCRSNNIYRQPQDRGCAVAGEFGHGKGRCRR
jgi:predicted DNA-binding protein (UPF0251 family)